MKIIDNNPYRLLGVYTTSPQKELVANQGKIKAFLKVGKAVDFSLDLNGILPAVQRSEESVAAAVSKLTLPAEQLKYAQFWFAKCTPIDEIACAKLTTGDIGGAMEIWGKKATASSLQGLLVCSLIKGEVSEAVGYAERLYSSYAGEFTNMVLGNNALTTTENLWHDFLDAMQEEYGSVKLLGWISNPQWKAYVGNRSIKPLVDRITAALEVCKSSRGKSITVRYNAGRKLMNDTKADLSQLKDLTAAEGVQYQMAADKVGLEILQCGIDYYNGSEAQDAAPKAMVLQRYALSVVVGKMAKDRCGENVQILEEIISKLPPAKVLPEHQAIQACLTTFAKKPHLITYSIALIKDCAPHIVAIKEKLGVGNQYYRQISTAIVDSALSNVISEVNEAQNKGFEIFKGALIRAWRAQLYMDKFDLEPGYREGRYKQCREALYGIIDQSKGFESSNHSSMYRYGCGWCNNLDVTDVDLRTDDKFYASCSDLISLKAYTKRFPSGKHIVEANERIERLTYQSAHTIGALDSFIKNYPHSKYVQEAKSKIEELRFGRCKGVSDFQAFINEFPTSKFVPSARQAMDMLIRKKEEEIAREVRKKVIWIVFLLALFIFLLLLE